MLQVLLFPYVLSSTFRDPRTGFAKQSSYVTPLNFKSSLRRKNGNQSFYSALMEKGDLPDEILKMNSFDQLGVNSAVAPDPWLVKSKKGTTACNEMGEISDALEIRRERKDIREELKEAIRLISTDGYDDWRMRDTSLVPPSGLTIRYKMGKLIGIGGSGSVYEAIDHERGRLVALKIMRCKDQDQLDMRVSEAIHMAELTSCGEYHPNIVNFYGMYRYNKALVMAMEKISGKELHYYIDTHLEGSGYMGLPVIEGMFHDSAGEEQVNGRRLKESHARVLLFQLLTALKHLHEVHHILHLDVKPENAIVDDSDGEKNSKLKLIDFGNSMLFNPNHKYFNWLGGGTPGYWDPRAFPNCPPDHEPFESARHEAKAKWRVSRFSQDPGPVEDLLPMRVPVYAHDIYAVGVTLYRMLHGVHKFVHSLSKTSFMSHRFSVVCMDLLRALLIELRFESVEEVLKHPWFDLGVEEMNMQTLRNLDVSSVPEEEKEVVRKVLLTPLS